MLKTTTMVNKREKIDCIISISDKRLLSFFISLILSLFFYLYLLSPYLFRFNFVVSERNVHILFLPTYLGGTLTPLLDISERNFFPRWGGVHVHPVHPPCVRACKTIFTYTMTRKSTFENIRQHWL